MIFFYIKWYVYSLKLHAWILFKLIQNVSLIFYIIKDNRYFEGFYTGEGDNLSPEGALRKLNLHLRCHLKEVRIFALSYFCMIWY